MRHPPNIRTPPAQSTQRAGEPALELLQLTEEVLDQVPPFVHLAVNGERGRAAWMLGDNHLGAALVQVRDDVIAVESGIADQRAECDPVDERRHADRVETLPWQE